MKSATKANELNLKYGKTFHFNIPTLDNMELSIKIKDDNICGDETITKLNWRGWCVDRWMLRRRFRTASSKRIPSSP